MARTRDSAVDEAIVDAALALLREQGFGAMTIEGVAARAEVGKPAIYRRFPDKAALAAAAIRTQLPRMEVVDFGDTHAELRYTMDEGFPPDAPAYVRLIGGLIAEEERHPELIAAFRETILLPRREIVMTLIRRGQERADLRRDVDPEAALDALAGPLLARVFAGADTSPDWRDAHFEIWWSNFKAKEKR
jgi:AcrR family transcriptional regulator